MRSWKLEKYSIKVVTSSADETSGRKNPEMHPAPEVLPSSPPWRAIRSSSSPPLQSLRRRVPEVVLRKGPSPMEAYRSPFSLMPIHHFSQQTDSSVVPVHVIAPHLPSNRLRKTHGGHRESPFPWRPDVECKESEIRMVVTDFLRHLKNQHVAWVEFVKRK